MLETITATYNSEDQLRSVSDDLINSGWIPTEKIYVDHEAMAVKVMVSPTIKREIFELLQRHNPQEVHERPVS